MSRWVFVAPAESLAMMAPALPDRPGAPGGRAYRRLRAGAEEAAARASGHNTVGEINSIATLRLNRIYPQSIGNSRSGVGFIIEFVSGIDRRPVLRRGTIAYQ